MKDIALNGTESIYAELGKYMHSALAVKHDILNSIGRDLNPKLVEKETREIIEIGHEGLIIEVESGSRVKIVDRNVFSRANFSYDYHRGF